MSIKSRILVRSIRQLLRWGCPMASCEHGICVQLPVVVTFVPPQDGLLSLERWAMWCCIILILKTGGMKKKKQLITFIVHSFLFSALSLMFRHCMFWTDSRQWMESCQALLNQARALNLVTFEALLVEWNGNVDSVGFRWLSKLLWKAQTIRMLSR